MLGENGIVVSKTLNLNDGVFEIIESQYCVLGPTVFFKSGGNSIQVSLTISGILIL